jgi:hypothetical protein
MTTSRLLRRVHGSPFPVCSWRFVNREPRTASKIRSGLAKGGPWQVVQRVYPVHKGGKMNPPLDAATDYRIEVTKIFAQQFNHFEWEYLCSYQWFLTGMDRGLETGDFTKLQARAQKALVDDRIRLRSAEKDSKYFVSWLD